MASGAILEDIDERFLQCSICLCQLKEPKSLPCLHHFCRDCLAKAVQEKDRDIQCPTCCGIYPLPQNGVDGFKTDFNTKNIIKFIQLKESVKDEPMRVCIACKKKHKASAYCFKCRDFLCESCHEFHVTNNIVEDHRPHISSLSEMEARNLSMEKLASLKEAPRCGTHPERLSELCCTSCDNQPICVACTYGAHQGHVLKEVTSLATLEREKLTKKTAELMSYKEKIDRMQEELKKSKEELDRAVKEKQEELQEEFALRRSKIKEEIKEKDGVLEKRKSYLEGMVKRKTSQKRQQLETEMKMAQEKYDAFCREEKESTDAEFKKLLQENEEQKVKSYQKLDVMTKELEDLLASVQTQEREDSKKIKEMLDHFDDIAKRFEIVTATASSIMAAKDDWTDVQCISDICTAQDTLIADMKRDFPDLATISKITVGGLSSAIPGRGVGVNITEREESAVNIEGVTGRGWSTGSITATGSEDGYITIAGKASEYQSHITVIKKEGRKIKQKMLQGPFCTYRFCDFISQSKVATVSWKYEIGIYDIRDGSYRKASIRNIINTCPSFYCVSCVTMDQVNNHILVGGLGMNDIYVFDYDLKHVTTLILPDELMSPEDMTVHEGSLLVCGGGRACAVTMEGGSACKIKFEFTKPDVGGADYKPWSVCTDQHGYVYMLWRVVISGQRRSNLVQYSQDGGQLLQSRLVDCTDDAYCITTMETEQGENLLLATENTGKLITYGLVSKEI